MSDDNSQPESISTYAELKLPEFKSDIPDYLTKDSTDAEKYILDQISILIQHAKWTGPVLVETRDQCRKTNGRVIRLESWKNMFSSWWALCGAIISIVGGIVGVIEIIKFLAKTP